MFELSRRRRALSGVAALFATQAFAQTTDSSSQDGNTLPAVIVHGTAERSLTSQSAADQKRELNETAGAVGFVDSESYANTYAFTLRDVLKNVPGVFVQNRRQFTQWLTASTTAAAWPAGFAHAQDMGIPASAPVYSPHHTMSGPKTQIAMLLYPHMVALDFIGPHTFLSSLGHVDVHLVAATREPVPSERGLPVSPTVTYDECPEDLDVVFVPGD